MVPPLLTPPQKALKRVLAIARFDSLSIMILAGLSLLLALVMVEPMGLTVSALAFFAGLTERRGCAALQRGDAGTGMKRLVQAQLFLLVVILVYCARCLFSFDAGFLQDQIIPELNQWMPALLGLTFQEFLQESGLTVDELVAMAQTTFMLFYGIVAAVSVLFQGGLALYYRRHTPLVAAALAEPPVVTRQSPLA